MTATASTVTRRGAVTFKGQPLTAIGPALGIGMQAPDFCAVGADLAPVTLATFSGQPILFSVTPSLDTPVCDAQAKRFNDEAAKLPGVAVVNVSMDLPFAQKRWCGTAGANRITVISDHREASFGAAYGVLIEELRLLARATFVVDRAGTLRYIEYVPEISSPPNYEAALAAIRQAAQ
jgi:thiol peroxidase